MVKFLKLVAFLFIQILGIYCIAQAASINDLEYQKFTTDSDGNPAIRIVLPDGGGTVGSANAISQLNSNVTVTDAADGYITMTEDGTEYLRLTGGNVGIGTTTPTQKLDVTGNVNFTGAATITKQLTLTDDLTVDTNTLKVDASTNRVGIGTALPAYALEVAGSVYASQSLTAVDVYCSGLHLTGSGSSLSFDSSASFTGDLTVTNQLFVGDTDCRFRQNTNALEFTNNAGSTWTALGSANAISQLNSNVTVTDAADGYITMTEDGTEYVRLTGGNVGIGTTTPSAKLETSAGIKVGGTNPTINLTSVTTVGQMQVDGTGIFDLTTRGANVRITDDMSVGTDLTISNNLSVNNTVRAKNVDLDKLASGTGVCYAVVVQSDGTLAKSGTVWNK